MRAGPKMLAGARPPTEKAPLELVLYCWCKLPVTPALAHALGPQCDRPKSALLAFSSFGEKSFHLEKKVVLLEKKVVFASRMRKTNVGLDSEGGLRKHSPALEVVTHSSLNRKFCIALGLMAKQST